MKQTFARFENISGLINCLKDTMGLRGDQLENEVLADKAANYNPHPEKFKTTLSFFKTEGSAIWPRNTTTAAPVFTKPATTSDYPTKTELQSVNKDEITAGKSRPTLHSYKMQMPAQGFTQPVQKMPPASNVVVPNVPAWKARTLG